ncbi:MAG: FAD-binding oxidoreductase [Acidobacteriales bacterium]|nr:FAD-binding oxidoreductase [Terriglobales bacterium]
MQTAEVAVIGGGIVGSSIAWHLANAGCTDVLVLERESAQGKGSTGKSMGGVRAQFTTPVNIQMSLYSIPFYRDFDDSLGHPAGYRAQGYLFVASRETHVAYLHKNQELQRSLGLTEVRWITRDDVRNIVPQLRTDDVLGASFCPTDGFVDPYSAMNGFMQAAKERGVMLWKNCEVQSIRHEQAGYRLGTTRGEVSARVVVNAAGAWSATVAQMLGYELPVKPMRRMLIPTEPFDGVSHSVPMVIDMTNGFHFRPEAAGFLLAWNDPDEGFSFNTDFDPDFVEKVLTRAADRVPVFENLAVNPKRCWAGLYEMSPDHHGILGEVDELRGFYIASGFSGHGVMHAPASGKIIADLITAGKTNIVSDAAVLNPRRFQTGNLLHESALL